MKTVQESDPEIEAISQVHCALSKLAPDAQKRVLEYVSKKLGLSSSSFSQEEEKSVSDTPTDIAEDRRSVSEERTTDEAVEDDGISPVAKKWMRRSDLDSKQLSTIFSIGGDDIDLIAKKVPGNTLSARMRSVFLLKGIAAYLSGGAPRFTHEQVKDACLHYDAYDSSNFAKRVKQLAAEISGNKESGYSLTARGLASATELIQQLLRLKMTE